MGASCSQIVLIRFNKQRFQKSKASNMSSIHDNTEVVNQNKEGDEDQLLWTRSPLDFATPHTSGTSSSNSSLHRSSNKHIHVDKINVAIRMLTWKDCEFICERNRGVYDDEGSEVIPLFDKLCRLFNIQLILQQPHILTIQDYEWALIDYFVFKGDEARDAEEALAVISREFFSKWFRGKNKGTKEVAGRGMVLYNTYRNMRNVIFRNWEKIFWQPSSASTSAALLWCDPSITAERFICPSVITRLPHIFGMCGRKFTDGKQGRLPPDIDRYIDTDNCAHNPFMHFIRASQNHLQDLISEVKKLKDLMTLTDLELVNRTVLEKEIPEKGTVEKLLLQKQSLSKLLHEISKWILFAKRSKLTVNDAEKKLLIARQFFEKTQMHVFLAAWTLWDLPGQPYFVDILRHMHTLAEYQMLLTEDFLGAFYMARGELLYYNQLR